MAVMDRRSIPVSDGADAACPPAPTCEQRVLRVSRTASEHARRALANESPVAVEFDGSPHAVMMLTPRDLEDFAVGFALSERVVAHPGEIARIDIRFAEAGIAIDVRLQKEPSAHLARRRRNLAGQTGCGICGIVKIADVLQPLDVLSGCPSVTAAALFSALDGLRLHQPVNAETGAVHAAAFCTPAGRIIAVREDVGRHNALDKIIGHLARSGGDAGAGFALVTSRCSYELVQKAVLARIPLLVAISAPTRLAVEIASQTRLTLIALARSDNMLVFNDPFQNFAPPD
jgi:FdhD protein